MSEVTFTDWNARLDNLKTYLFHWIEQQVMLRQWLDIGVLPINGTALQYPLTPEDCYPKEVEVPEEEKLGIEGKAFKLKMDRAWRPYNFKLFFDPNDL